MKRSCRLSPEEKDMHERAVKLRKMTDAQLCAYMDQTFANGVAKGAGQARIMHPTGRCDIEEAPREIEIGLPKAGPV